MPGGHLPGMNLVELVAFGAGGLAFLLMMRESVRRERYAEQEAIGIARAGMLMGLVWSWGAALMFLAEHRSNTAFATPLTAFWSMAVYLLSGFEDRGPVTALGRFLGVLFMLGGVSAVAYLTGELASYLTVRKISRRKEIRGMEILIVNWEHRADRLVLELNAYAETMGRPRPRIVVLTEEPVETRRYRELDDYRAVEFVTGDPYSKELLASIGAHEARAAVVLAAGEGDADARVALAVLTLRALARERHGEREGAARPLIVAESRNHRKRAQILDAGANDVLTPTDLHMGLLAQTAESPANAAVYRNLLHASGDTAEVYVLDGLEPGAFASRFEGRTFPEAAAALLGLDPPVILAGVVRDGELMMAPGAGEFDRFRPGDVPVVIAHTRPEFGADA